MVDKNTDIQDEESVIKEMMQAGLHFGHKKTFNHPKADYFTVKSYDAIAGIDLKETLKALDKASEFLKDTVRNNGTILLVGTNPGAKEAIQALAQKFNYPYVTERWLGGTLTNFKTLTQRIKTLKNLEEQKTTGGWDKYTKKEKSDLEKELLQLQRKFAGLRALEKLPAAIFIIDTGTHDTAVREAKLLNIPVVGVLDTDDDPTIIKYPIPANDSAKSAITYLMGIIDKAIEEGIKTVVKKEEPKDKATEK
jgi:small subunit ribosomal protein S2